MIRFAKPLLVLLGLSVLPVSATFGILRPLLSSLLITCIVGLALLAIVVFGRADE